MSIAANLASLHQQMQRACDVAQRDPAGVRLMAVSKTHPASAILEAHAAGQRLFGENRVQEVQQKSPELASLEGLQMHLIGPLQNNKTSKAAELFCSIDSIDSLKTAARLDGTAAALGKKLDILLEVKLSPEESKHGIAPSALSEMLESLKDLKSLTVTGLMTVPPWTDDPASARPYFRSLRQLRDEHLHLCPTLTQLSMGMSHDFAVAIEEGSTTIRLGTAVFGSRGTS